MKKEKQGTQGMPANWYINVYKYIKRITRVIKKTYKKKKGKISIKQKQGAHGETRVRTINQGNITEKKKIK